MQIPRLIAGLALVVTLSAGAVADAGNGTRFSVTFPVDMSSAPLDGRLILLLSRDFTREPRTHVEANEPLDSPYLFGMNVDAWSPGANVTLNDKAFGWPAARLSAVPSGDYSVQAVLNRYETFHLADGRTLKLPPDKGEGQQWARKPGNLYSTPVQLHIDRAHPVRTAVGSRSTDARRIATQGGYRVRQAHPDPQRVAVASSGAATCIWARTCWCRRDSTRIPQAHYPLMVFHGHFPDDISEFRTTPPDPNLKPDYSERFHLAGYNRIQQQEAYAFYQKWISADFPRFLVIEIEHANPYYDDSYAVNSANLGPYGDAINKELIPEIEKRFRGIGAGWARFTYGGSTGGWEALATQVFYPDMYNGAFAACPDPDRFSRLHGHQPLQG